MLKNKYIRKLVKISFVVFTVLNIIAFFHSYKFTHFSTEKIDKTKDPKRLSVSQKLKVLFLGISNPRPELTNFPENNYETIKIKSNKDIECWMIKTENSKGTVVLFHGFSGNKSTLIDKSEIFLKKGYNTLLVDFMGCGNSEGNQTTIGFYEALQVKSCVDYLNENGEKNIVLYGTSMGAVAIMKALNDFNLLVNSIILECPFGTMYQTVCSRFKTMNVPTFPMAGLLVFWGGAQNNFWAFGHKPTHYAKNINCPTLLIYGEKDEKVSRNEIDEIFNNLKGQKTLKVIANAGHENFLRNHKQEWENEINYFLNKIN